MYLLSVVVLLGVLPVVSIAVEMLALHTATDPAFTILKWFVFWAVGIRLLLAGLRQMTNPAFTAKTIFDSSDTATQKVVKELGIGNLAIGVLGAAALFEKEWVLAAAVTGGLFYGLAGLQHARNSDRNAHQKIAMISDLAIFAILALGCVADALRAGPL